MSVASARRPVSETSGLTSFRSFSSLCTRVASSSSFCWLCRIIALELGRERIRVAGEPADIVVLDFVHHVGLSAAVVVFVLALQICYEKEVGPVVVVELG